MAPDTGKSRSSQSARSDVHQLRTAISLSELRAARDGTLREYRGGLAVSVALHLGIVVAALVGLPHFRREFPVDSPPVPVEIVDIADVTREKAEVVEKTEEAPPPDATTPPPPSASEAPPTEDKAAEEEPVEDAVPLPDQKPKEKPAEKKAPVPGAIRTKPDRPNKFNADRISALLDKSVKEDVKSDQKKDNVLDRIAKNVKPGQREQMTSRFASATIVDYLKKAVGRCWSPPAGNLNASQQIVVMRLRFREDGTLYSPPTIVEQATQQSGEAARRAVIQCAPYTRLPRDQYEVWREIEFTFNPSEMTGM